MCPIFVGSEVAEVLCIKKIFVLNLLTLQSLTGKYMGFQGNPCNENRDPAMKTGVPCNENRVTQH